jgi:hypothetical protein
MAEADFAELTGTALDSTHVARGVSNYFTRPTGGGNFVFGYRGLDANVGVAGYYVDLANFNPIPGAAKGGSISAAMKRYSASLGFAPIIGLLVGTDPSTSYGYFLGLSNEASFKICLKKGLPVSGLLSDDSGILAVSDASYVDTGDAVAHWFHLRLDVLVNPHNEVVINCYMNTANVTTPTWGAITGIDSYIDDSLGEHSGSLPYLTGFYPFFGHYTSAGAGCVSLFDQLVVQRQTSP